MSKELYTDSELIKLLQTDDEVAFEIIYKRYWERLYGIVYNRLQSKEVSEEIIQDLFTELWDRRQKLTIYKSLASYLFCALKYKIFNHISSQAVRKRHIHESQKRSLTFANTTEEKLSFDELYTLMEKEIGNLPKKCQLVFQLSRKGNTAKQIAEKLDISPRTAEAHINHARKVLKTKLSGYTTVLLFLLDL